MEGDNEVEMDEKQNDHDEFEELVHKSLIEVGKLTIPLSPFIAKNFELYPKDIKIPRNHFNMQ